MVNPESLPGRVTLFCGDCIEVMAQLAENSVDAVVCDPPYHLTSIVKRFGNTALADGTQTSDRSRNREDGYARLATGFMGKKWDGGDVAFRPETWAAVLRVLKPGGHLLAFGGTRTYHRLACAIEDAGFEIRDQIQWLYGCLDDQTKVATAKGVKSHCDVNIGDMVLCYDLATQEYSYQPILEVVEYDYDDTAFRIVGDFGEQVVTRNHRCIIERGGKEIFRFAEEIAREFKTSIPILEDLPELQRAVSSAHQRTSCQKQNLLQNMHEKVSQFVKYWIGSSRNSQRKNTSNVLRLRKNILAQYKIFSSCLNSSLFLSMQRQNSWFGLETACPQGARKLDLRVRRSAKNTDDWINQSSVEGRVDVSQPKGQVRQPIDQICSLSNSVLGNGAVGWVRNGASAYSGAGTWSSTDAIRDGSSSEPQCDGQQKIEFNAFRDKRGTQSIRAWRGHKSSLVRIMPFHYTGSVWCLRVPTGAFVAVRGGVAFPTGNSGFPKSHDISKAIDRTLGAECEKVAPRSSISHQRNIGNRRPYMDDPNHMTASDEPASDAAVEWDGWGTALKPAHEPIVLARKPLSEGTVAANVLRWGTGALNIDGCRVGDFINETSPGTDRYNQANFGHGYKPNAYQSRGHPLREARRNEELDKSRLVYGNGIAGSKAVGMTTEGRWPANVIHDGSEEVVGMFPGERPAGGNIKSSAPSDKTGTIFGAFTGRFDNTSYQDSGTAARFFYTAKADGNERIGSKHPTVKPVDLIQYLVRLITPPNGTVLDCFAGTGTTGEAAFREGFNAVLIEREAEYQVDIRRRMELALAGPDERKRESIKARGLTANAGPLFGFDDEIARGGGRQIYGEFADEGGRRKK